MVVILVMFFFIYKVYNLSITGGIGGERRDYETFIKETEKEAKEVNYDIGGNRDLPNVNEIGGFRV